MNTSNREYKMLRLDPWSKGMILMLIVVLVFPIDLLGQTRTSSIASDIPATELPTNAFDTAASDEPTTLPDSIPLSEPLTEPSTTHTVSVSDTALAADTAKVATPPEWEPREYEFNPDPTRAVWLSAIFPGLGQIYNRRYWKLPIIVGGYLGLGYATNWNNNMLRDYTRAYADIMDNDPSTNSYMDFFPTTTNEADLDKTWLTNTLRSRKNFYRRNRDLCIICMVGVYLVAMLDAYVDASLSHFDISTDLSLDVAPAVIQDGRNIRPSIGLQWAINF